MQNTTPSKAGEARPHPKTAQPTTRAVDSNGSPLTAEQAQLIDDSATWARSELESQIASTRLAWRITAASIALALMGWGMGLFTSTRPVPPPTVITVDRLSGDTQVSGPFDKKAVPQLTVADQHWAQRYVLACETYNYNFLKRDYEQCARMSSPKVFAPYSAQYAGDSARQAKVGNREEDSVRIVGIRTQPGAEPGRSGVVVVTFDKTVKTLDGRRPSTTRYLGTCEFEYQPEAMKAPVDRIENPFGFLCKNYRKDPELQSPAEPAATPAAATNGVSKPDGSAS